MLQSYVSSSRVRRHYTPAQALLPFGERKQIEAKCFEGAIDLPTMGYLRAPKLTRSRTVLVNLLPKPHIISPTVPSVYVPPVLVSREIEVLERIPAAYRMLFWADNPQARVSRSIKDRRLLTRATSLLEKASVLSMLTDVTASVLLFCGSDRNSFYDTRAHGTVFIRFTKAGDEFHLIEEFVHQAGHALFSILMSQQNRYCFISERAPICSLGIDSADTRPFGVALHGLVTEALIADTFLRIFSLPSVSTSDRHQVLGRLAFSCRKLAADLHLIAKLSETFTQEGLILLGAISRTCSQIFRRFGARLERVDLSRQTYVFSPKRYAGLNKRLS
ncbi:hypothetical protein GGD66_003669 [Bradyrhizobium sp. CIR48]|nr:hypothetical protein [Bradyrhizobium sp. CIR48]